MIKNVNLQARNCEVEDSMREHFENKLNSLEKMSSHPTDAEVRIKHERGHYVAEITLFGHGTVTRAEERDSDLRAAFDTATQKLQSQMRRYKDKLQETGRRHNNRDDQNGVVLHPKTSDEVTSAATIAPLSMPARQYDEVAPGADASAGEEADMDALMDETHADDSMVRVKRFALKPMSPDEAALQMDLLGHDFFVFRNSRDNEVGVVYRRESGGYGLIEPVPD